MLRWLLFTAEGDKPFSMAQNTPKEHISCVPLRATSRTGHKDKGSL